MARGGIGMNTHVYNAMLHMCLRAGPPGKPRVPTRMDAADMSAGPLLVQHPDRALRQEGDAVRGGSEWRARDNVTWNTVFKDGRMKEAAQLHMDMVWRQGWNRTP
jgi:hypothetical protein